jgi:tRNA pseudouridine38-40 synthase
MNMFRIRLGISYDGTGYGGFQIQDNAPTIQGELEKALAVIYKQPLRITGAGRTDAGVHALGQAAHYDAPFEIPSSRLPAALNALLPEDIVVFKAEPAAPDFHARFSALRKIYSYTLDRAAYPQVMRRRYSCHLPGPFNQDAVREACRLLEGTHDFRAFQATGSPVQYTERTLYRVELVELAGEKLLRLIFEGDGFLYKMVRLMVGSLLRVGQGKLEPAAVSSALEGRRPGAVGPTAPPQGLCLEKVIY